MGTFAIIISWLEATLRWSAPLIICACGEVFSERAGIINMGIEGIMLCGALCSVAVAYYSNSLIVAVLACLVVGIVMGFLVGYLTVSRRANHVVTGLMINMLCSGITEIIFTLMAETRHNRAKIFPAIFPKFLQEKIPFIGPVVLSQPISTWVAFLMMFLASFLMYRMRWGLNVRAVGDNPYAAQSAGLSVIKIKYEAVILSSICASLAGCVLTLSASGFFAAGGMTGGRGFIVLAAVVVGGWDPIRVCLACVLFGATDAIQLRLQTAGVGIPNQFFQMLPYVMTVIVLTIMVKKSRVPKTWGASWDNRRS